MCLPKPPKIEPQISPNPTAPPEPPPEPPVTAVDDEKVRGRRRTRSPLRIDLAAGNTSLGRSGVSVP